MGESIVVPDPGGPPDGMKITVPPNAYRDNIDVKIGYAPIKNHTLGKHFNPVSPLISIDNGGQYADDVMTVTVPVSVPEGHFAMGFFYDKENGTLEGIPVAFRDGNSITLATRHFSNFVISIINTALLYVDIDSGFRPGIDDWHFSNSGSYIAPWGHCSGQSMTAMWYYLTKPDGQDAKLFGRYDNNGDQPATPDLWYDDSLGYRFCSVIQCDNDHDNFLYHTGETISVLHQETWYLFAYSILLTGEPQMVIIIDSTKEKGHAVVVYHINQGKLHVADPNFPGDGNRSIEFSDGRFKPYSSGSNAEDIRKGTGSLYDKIIYAAKTAIIDWNKIGSRWAELKDRIMGNDIFPGYYLYWIDEQNGFHDLKDGHKTSKKMLPLNLSFDDKNIKTRYWVLENGRVKTMSSRTSNGPVYELSPGNNKLGFYIAGIMPDNEKRYIDFKYINVIYEKQLEWILAGTRIKPEGGVGWGGSGEVTETTMTLTESGKRGRWVPQWNAYGNDPPYTPYTKKAMFSFSEPPDSLTPGKTVSIQMVGEITLTGPAEKYGWSLKAKVYSIGLEQNLLSVVEMNLSGGNNTFRIEELSFVVPPIHPAGEIRIEFITPSLDGVFHTYRAGQ